MSGVKSRLDSLLDRLEGASSVATEAQEVVKAEGNIQQLEVWLVNCGKFAANQNILGQIEEHKVSQTALIIIHVSQPLIARPVYMSRIAMDCPGMSQDIICIYISSVYIHVSSA